MNPAGRLAAACVIAAITPGLRVEAQQAPQITYRSSVDLVAVDVTVVDRDGKPIAGLKTGDFEVWINGRPRRIVSVDSIGLFETRTSASLSIVAPQASVASPPSITPQRPRDVTGRVVILAIDEGSLTANAARMAMKAAQQFITKLPPEDVVGVYAFPFGVPMVDLLHDHAAVARALDRVTGRFSPPDLQHMITLSEVVDITAGDTHVLEAVVARECSEGDPLCRQYIVAEAAAKAAYYESQYTQSLGDLRSLLRDLDTIQGRKIVVFVSGGLIAPDRPGGRPDATAMIKAAGAEAAASNAILYALHVDTSFAEAFSASRKANGSSSTLDAGAWTRSLGRDSFAQASGLETMAAVAGGAVIRDQVGAGEIGFARILRETSAYYLLGVEPVEADRDGRTHFIRVKAKPKGATVRARSEVLIPRPRR